MSFAFNLKTKKAPTAINPNPITLDPVMILSRGPNPMGEMTKVVKMLHQEHTRLTDELHRVTAALTAFVGVYKGAKPKTRKKRTMSAAGRKRIAAAQRARWLKIKAKKKAA
jgi:hypothetical protein